MRYPRLLSGISQNCRKKIKKALDRRWTKWYNGSTSASGLFLLRFFAPSRKAGSVGCRMREVHGAKTFAVACSNKFKWEVPKKWLMMQESRLLWFVQSASRETMTQRRTRRTILTDLNSRSTAGSAASTLFTKNQSNFLGRNYGRKGKEGRSEL